MVLPLTYWVPSIAPSGMAFIKNGQADNEADILIGALAGTHIHWLKMKDNKRVSSTRSMNGYARFRDVRQAPDGKIYAMTETPNQFVLLRSSVPIANSLEDKSMESFEKDLIYPNPSFGVSELSFYLRNSQFVIVRILNTNGVLQKELTAEIYSAGKHSLPIDSDELPQGIYIIEIEKGGSKTFLKWVKM
jgi:hypothetical protein